MAKEKSKQGTFDASIWIDEPKDTDSVPNTFPVSGGYQAGFGPPMVKCVLVHPNGNTYSFGPFPPQEPADGKWNCSFNNIPPTSTTFANDWAFLTAHLLDETGGTEIAPPYGPVEITIHS
jgi:hypothetical protein